MTKVPDYLDNSYENAIQDLVDRGFRYRIEIVEVEAEKGKNNVVVDRVAQGRDGIYGRYDDCTVAGTGEG